jgi:hypothetical protein
MIFLTMFSMGCFTSVSMVCIYGVDMRMEGVKIGVRVHIREVTDPQSRMQFNPSHPH